MSELPKWFIMKCHDCRRCDLHKTRRNVVIGRGSIPAEILFLGEAPGKSEDMIGEPFIGAAGKLLDEIIVNAVRLSESGIKPYYITNTVMCRPTDSIVGDNRAPAPHEIAACASHVMTIFKIIHPKIVVFVGKVAERFYKKEFSNNITILHPAFILRQGGKNSPLFLQTSRVLSEIIKKLK